MAPSVPERRLVKRLPACLWAVCLAGRVLLKVNVVCAKWNRLNLPAHGAKRGVVDLGMSGILLASTEPKHGGIWLGQGCHPKTKAWTPQWILVLEMETGRHFSRWGFHRKMLWRPSTWPVFMFWIWLCYGICDLWQGTVPLFLRVTVASLFKWEACIYLVVLQAYSSTKDFVRLWREPSCKTMKRFRFDARDLVEAILVS